MTLRRPLTVVSVALVASCHPPGCDPPKPVPTTECWTPKLGGTNLDCVSLDHEPNDSLMRASPAPAAECEDVQVRGTLSGSDVDMFHAHGELCEGSAPNLAFDAEGTRACLFVQCSTGSTGFEGAPCSDGSIPMHLPSGLVGCCLEQPGGVHVNALCSGSDTNVDLYLVVDGASDECVPYALTYRL